MSELEGKLAPPMVNGEVVFEAPWQGRAFGMARALCEAGLFSWDEFRDCLMAEVAAWDQDADGDYAYYTHFLRALEVLLTQKGLLRGTDLGARVERFLARPHGHDHSHDHHHEPDLRQ